MWKSKLKKENEFLKRLVAAILPKADVCEICVFRGTMPNDCVECMACKSCELDSKKTCACCDCDSNCSNFLWDGKSPR